MPLSQFIDRVCIQRLFYFLYIAISRQCHLYNVATLLQTRDGRWVLMPTQPNLPKRIIGQNTGACKGPFIIYDGGWAGKKRGWVMRSFLVKGGGGHLNILVQKGGVELFIIVEKNLTCNDYCNHRSFFFILIHANIPFPKSCKII